VRIRLGDEWRGLPWDAIGQVIVHPRKGFLRDGRLVFAPRSLARALDGLDARARRHVALNQKMYGAALAVPIGATTRVSTSGERSVVEEISALALGRADVVELDPKTLEVVEPGDSESSAESDGPDGTPAPAGQVPDQPQDDAAPAAQTEVESPREVFPRRHDNGEPEPRSRGGFLARARSVADSPTQPPVQSPVGPPTQPLAGPPVEAPAVPQALSAESDAGSAAAGTAAGAVTVADRSTVAAPEAGDGELSTEQPGPRVPRRSILGGIGTIVSRVAKGRAHDIDGQRAPGAESVASEGTASPAAPQPAPFAPTAALRDTRPGLRAEATLDIPPSAGNTALDPTVGEDEAQRALPEGRELRRPGSVDLVFERVDVDDRVRPISTLGDPVEPLVIDDFVTEPAYDPVIGPELSAARTRLGLSVDELAERTRIRPHVIESIEVDDFAPCGGDFYARGHLRTLARILGKDVDPLLVKFEERYATAPINARRVFEAELATGMTGSIRSTVGGPNWGLLVGVVLSLVLVWGVVRLFTTEPVDIVEMPAPALNGSAGVGNAYPAQPPAPEARGAVAKPVAVRLTASQSDSEVVVRDGEGVVVFTGELVLGERKTLRVVPPMRIRAADGGAVEVRVGGRDMGLLGTAGEPVRRVFVER